MSAQANPPLNEPLSYKLVGTGGSGMSAQASPRPRGRPRKPLTVPRLGANHDLHGAEYWASEKAGLDAALAELERSIPADSAKDNDRARALQWARSALRAHRVHIEQMLQRALERERQAHQAGRARAAQ